ncbi:ATP-binding protein [Streptomyces dangxiongensis]|uniref:hypothetical protein n=1 Tax=Streptomyces dangxiongensis TaxID=1442032 RepID=UPI00196A0288|nr:hypothetical protein [Streptomyces dangxiongensis]
MSDSFTQLTSVTECAYIKAESGRGLSLVDAVVDKWGFLGIDAGEIISFECGVETRM